MIRNKKHLFDSKQADFLWKKSDDAYRSTWLLSDLYNNVPVKLRNVKVNILRFEIIEESSKIKKEVLKWMNK